MKRVSCGKLLTRTAAGLWDDVQGLLSFPPATLTLYRALLRHLSKRISASGLKAMV